MAPKPQSDAVETETRTTRPPPHHIHAFHRVSNFLHSAALHLSSQLETTQSVGKLPPPATMLLPLPQLPDAWDALRGVATLPQFPSTPTGCATGPVLLFVAADVDSVAASRTLTALLKADLVRYEVHPIVGYEQLAARFDELATGEDSVGPRAVLCVNCGAAVDIAKILGLDDMEEPPPVFIMDAHRPFHLRNLTAENVVVIDDDDAVEDDAFPLDAGIEDEYGHVSDHELSDAEDESSESEVDSMDDSDEDRDDDDDLDSEEDQGSDIEDESDVESAPTLEDSDAESEDIERAIAGEPGLLQDTQDSSATPATSTDSTATEGTTATSSEQQPRARKRKAPARRRAKRRRSGDKDTTTSTPSGERTRRRRRRKRRERVHVSESEKERIRDYYANSFLAMSSACLSHNLAHTLRRASVDTLWLAIVGVTAQYLNAGVSDELYNDAIAYFRAQLAQFVPAPAEGESALENVGYGTSTARDLMARRVAPSLELRLDLVRHWTLHDSLLKSSYTVSRLAAWKQKGKKRLLELLATLGIPRNQAQQQWAFMRQEFKDALDTRLPNVVRRFDLGTSIQYESFVRALPGHRGAASAADIAHAVAALLEADNNGPNIITPPDAFWNAYDALAPTAAAGALASGLRKAVRTQSTVADVVAAVIERKEFTNHGPFRYVMLKDAESHGIAARPLLLRRVALFLIEAVARQGKQHKPFVILAPDRKRAVWVVVAATAVGRRNDFGVRFRIAAQKKTADVRHVGFESAVCEVPAGEEVTFVRFLHSVLR